MTGRQQRLKQDFGRMQQLRDLNRGAVDFTSDYSNPPVHYRVTFRCAGVRLKDGRRVPVDHHEVDIFLGPKYPDEEPVFQWRTPIVHPNILGQGVCPGVVGHWDAVTIPLDKVVVRLWDMARYRLYNVDSVLDPDEAQWARRNGQSLPCDKKELVEVPFAIAPDQLPEIKIIG